MWDVFITILGLVWALLSGVLAVVGAILGLVWALLPWVLAVVGAILGLVLVVYLIARMASIVEGLWQAIVALSASVISDFWRDIMFVHDVLVFDTHGHRQKVAEELNECATKVRELGDPESLKKLERAAQCPDSFKRSYALDALGRLGERASEAVAIQVKGLASRDPFVREAAAQALSRMGSQAAQAREALVEVLRTRRSEGTARYAVLALRQIGGLKAEDLKVLEATALAPNSYAAEEAAELFEHLEGRRPAQAGGPMPAPG
jgi:HEAT repeats